METKLLTEKQWVERFIDLGWPDGCTDLLEELRERGLIAEPVDPLLVEAREIVAEIATGLEMNPLRSGKYDKGQYVCIALAALKRGMELAEPKPLTRENMREAYLRALSVNRSSMADAMYEILVEQMK
jgi:hypothetical protein